MFIVKERQKTLDLSKVFFWFIIYSFIGWVYETAYCSITTQKLADRGILYGPICPIYGACIVLMIVVFENNKKSISLFFQCAFIASVMEYVISCGMEKVLHRRWWNYSSMPFNINGRICIVASILFGISGVLFVRYIHPNLVQYINMNLSEKSMRKCNRIFLVLYIYDNFITFKPFLN